MSILGTAVSDLKKAGEAVKSFFVKAAGDVPAIMTTIAADEAKIAPVIEEFVPGSTTAMALANTLLDAIAQAVEDAGAAASANGLTVALDKSTVASVQAVISAAKEMAAPIKAAAAQAAKL